MTKKAADRTAALEISGSFAKGQGVSGDGKPDLFGRAAVFGGATLIDLHQSSIMTIFVSSSRTMRRAASLIIAFGLSVRIVLDKKMAKQWRNGDGSGPPPFAGRMSDPWGRHEIIERRLAG